MALINPFRFVDLPPELRNRVYEFTFAASTTTISTSKTYRLRVTHTSSPGDKFEGLPGLLHANSQLRFESAFVFYSTTNFIAYPQHKLLDWLMALDPTSKSAIRHLSLRGYYVEPYEAWLQKDLEIDKSDFARELEKRGIEFNTSLITFEIWKWGERERRWPKM